MIKFDSVSKSYGSFRAVSDISLEVHAGEIMALIGPSGSGKTTTMKMINRLIDPSHGTIYIDGKNSKEQNPVTLRRNIGYVIQHIGLLPHMTIADNIALVPKLNKWDKALYQARVDELLEMVGLDPVIYRSRYPSELSGGQQQRIGVARALAADPPIILMDEPFSALDPISRQQLQDEMLRLQQKLHKTVVFVTHDIDEAIKIADRICIMRQGKLVQVDTPEHVLRHPANEFVKTFIGRHRISQGGSLPTIREVLVKAVTSRPNRGLAESINGMRKQKVDTLLIVDNDDRLLGIVGVAELQSHFHDEDLTLENVMCTDFPIVSVNQTLEDAMYLISKHHLAYLPAVDEDNALLGVITRASLVDAMAKHFNRYPSSAKSGGVSAAC